MTKFRKRPEGMSFVRNAIYAVYKGEEMVAMGTQQECAEELGVTPDYIHWLTTPTGRARQANRKNPEKVNAAEIIDWE